MRHCLFSGEDAVGSEGIGLNRALADVYNLINLLIVIIPLNLIHFGRNAQ